MKDQVKSVRFEKKEMEVLKKISAIERRSISDLVRTKAIEKIIEEQKEILNELIEEYGLKSKEVLEQSMLIDALLNKI